VEVSVTGGIPWRFIGIYGEPQEAVKYKMWQLMEDLAAQNQKNQPQLCASDF
jgi:hypothetical protein